MTPAKVKIGFLEWTPWPTWPLPDEALLIKWAETHGLRFITDFHAQRERNIANERHDPLSYGWEAPPFKAARELIEGRYVPGQFGVVLNPQFAGQPLGPADDLLLMLANRIGKSTFGGRWVNEMMQRLPGARVRCFAENIDLSRALQQASVYRFLPPDLRKIKRQGQFCKISYTAVTGFTEETLAFPQGKGTDYAQCWFMTVAGWRNEPNSVEGFQADGIWGDEKMPADLMETLRARRGERKLQLLFTYTPKDGYTDAVAQYIEGGEIIEAVPARRVEYDWWERSWKWGEWVLPPDKELVPGCPPGHVPFLIRHPTIAGRMTMCASSSWNPYIDFDDLMKSYSDKPLETKLIRWFGWPLKKVRPALAFVPAHIVPAENVPPLAELTIYLIVDPCPPPRNWFMLWLGVDREERVWVLAEWPDIEVGEWAVPGSEPDGKPGPGAFEGGRGGGFDAYKLLILEREGWTEEDGAWAPGPKSVRVFDRLLDPRAASWKVPSAEEDEAKSYIDLLLEPVRRQRDGKEIDLAPGLHFLRAPGAGIEEGNELINGWLTRGWDSAQPLTPMNCPRFYINAGIPNPESRTQHPVHPFLRVGCGNTIWALRTFTGRKRSGAKDEGSACKDPIDCLKAAAKLGVSYVGDQTLMPVGGGSY